MANGIRPFMRMISSQRRLILNTSTQISISAAAGKEPIVISGSLVCGAGTVERHDPPGSHREVFSVAEEELSSKWVSSSATAENW